jgi:hypothetical protein
MCHLFSANAIFVLVSVLEGGSDLGEGLVFSLVDVGAIYFLWTSFIFF